MKKQAALLWIFMGLPIVCIPLFFIGYIATRPIIYVKIGCFYYEGKIVSQNYTTAARWFRRAAEHGNAFGQEWLGYCYLDGKGVPKNYEEAAKWSHAAAQQGRSRAQYNLGNAYYSGKGVPLDYTEAVIWFKKAAEQGIAPAQRNVGYAYQTGTGVQTNLSEAILWYEKAAEQGDARAQCNLGVCYAEGLGVPKNMVISYSFFFLGSQHPNKDDPAVQGAMRNLEVFKKLYMSPEQIEQGKALAKEFARKFGSKRPE